MMKVDAEFKEIICTCPEWVKGELNIKRRIEKFQFSQFRRRYIKIGTTYDYLSLEEGRPELKKEVCFPVLLLRENIDANTLQTVRKWFVANVHAKAIDANEYLTVVDGQLFINRLNGENFVTFEVSTNDHQYVTLEDVEVCNNARAQEFLDQKKQYYVQNPDGQLRLKLLP